MFAFRKSDRAGGSAGSGPGGDAAQALQIAVLWGEDSVLYEASLSPPRAFAVGDAEPAAGEPAADFTIGAESLGTSRLPIAVMGAGGPEIVVPAGATLEVVHGVEQRSLAVLEAAGELVSCGELPGARAYRLHEGTRARLGYRGFTFAVSFERAVERSGLGVGAAIGWDRRATRCTVGSMSLHLACLLLFQLLPPHSSALSIDDVSARSRLVSTMIEAREREIEELKMASEGGEAGGDPATPAAPEDPGKMRDAKRERIRRAPPNRNAPVQQDPDAATNSPAELAANAGIISVLRGAIPVGGSQTFDPSRAIDYDAGAISILMGAQDGGGLAGLGLSLGVGSGRGGGGPAWGTVGVGGLGTVSGLGGDGGGPGRGYGKGAGRLDGRDPRVPPVIVGKPEIRGGLSKETIRRVIQLHLKEIRYCYEQGLQTRPDLEGRIAVRFMIDPSGIVKVAARASSDLGSGKVEGCILDAVRRWTFPAPDGGGLVTVTYPFVLQQSGQ